MSFGVYVHWPFCAAKCPYCDFNSHVRTAIDEDGWVDGILSELEWTAKNQGASATAGATNKKTRPVVETIFFGGGTPSLMQGKSVGRVLQKIVEPALGADGKPLAGMVKVRFVLPEFIDDQIDVGLTYDRLLTDQKQEVAIPDIAHGRQRAYRLCRSLSACPLPSRERG